MTDTPLQAETPVSSTQAQIEQIPQRLKRLSGEGSPAIPVAVAAAITGVAVITAIKVRQRRQSQHRLRQSMQRAASAASERLGAVGRVAARPIAARPDIAADLAVGALMQMFSVMARQGDTSNIRRGSR